MKKNTNSVKPGPTDNQVVLIFIKNTHGWQEAFILTNFVMKSL